MTPSELWTTTFQSNAQPVCRLICFPSAGGGAAGYRTWASQLPPEVEVRAIRLPGRETRLNEPPVTNLTQLVETLVQILTPYMQTPFAFFGHSMGSMVSFEVVRYLRQHGLPMPEHLFISAWPAPQLRKPRQPIAGLPDPALVSAIQERYGGIPAVILQEPDLLKLFLPAIRADIGMLEQYTYTEEAPLPCPISAFGGTRDKTATESELRAWKAQTHAQFACQMFIGEHFYLQSQQQALLQVIRTDLERIIHRTTSSQQS